MTWSGVVPQVMHGDHADLVIVADPPEAADQVAGLDGQTAAGGEDQASVLPGTAKGGTVSFLLILAGSQSLACKRHDRQIAVSSASLERPGSQNAADARAAIP